jgi:hypothetical protein
LGAYVDTLERTSRVGPGDANVSRYHLLLIAKLLIGGLRALPGGFAMGREEIAVEDRDVDVDGVGPAIAVLDSGS